MHPHRAGKPLGIRKGLTMDADDETRAWLIALWPIALAVAITVGILMAHDMKAPAPAESPPPAAAPDIRTEVPTGRMICEKTGEHGCAEWRIYRTVEH